MHPTKEAVGLTLEVIIPELGNRCIEGWLLLETMVDDETHGSALPRILDMTPRK